MIKSMIVSVLLPGTLGAGFLAGGGHLPALPSTDAPPAAAVAAPAAQAPSGGFQVIATCDDPQDAPRAAQGPAQARKAQERRVVVQVPQAVAAAPAEAPEAKPQRAESAAPTSAAAPSSSAPSSTGGINVNDPANDAALLALPGLGQSALTQINIARKAGPIKSVEDVGKLPGVTAANFAKYKDRITV